VKHDIVKNTTITNANIIHMCLYYIVKVKTHLFTLRYMYKGPPLHVMQCKPKSKNSMGDFGFAGNSVYI